MKILKLASLSILLSLCTALANASGNSTSTLQLFLNDSAGSLGVSRITITDSAGNIVKNPNLEDSSVKLGNTPTDLGQEPLNFTPAPQYATGAIVMQLNDSDLPTGSFTMTFSISYNNTPHTISLPITITNGILKVTPQQVKLGHSKLCKIGSIQDPSVNPIQFPGLKNGIAINCEPVI